MNDRIGPRKKPLMAFVNWTRTIVSHALRTLPFFCEIAQRKSNERPK
jgi:hypothetical protein